MDENSVPQIPFKFIVIEEIQNLTKNTKCDFVGILIKVWDMETTPNNKIKRDLSSTDNSKSVILITLLGLSRSRTE